MSDITMIEHSNGFIRDHIEVISDTITAWIDLDIDIDIKNCLIEIKSDLEKNNYIDGILKLMLIIKILLEPNYNKSIIESEHLYYILDLSLGITNAYSVCNSKVIRSFIRNKSIEL